jgi:hypothetical protein
MGSAGRTATFTRGPQSLTTKYTKYTKNNNELDFLSCLSCISWLNLNKNSSYI